MAGNKYLTNFGGAPAEVAAIQSSAGAGDAGKIPALDSSGRLDSSMLPTGVGADTASVQASENLSAGDFVNIWDSGGNFRVRRADASTTGKQADGFVLSAVTSGANATVYFEGSNTAVTGATPGEQFLSDSTPGGFTATVPTGSGKIAQKVGIAVSATVINFDKGVPITLA
jgi:hypothetical protein